MHRLLAETASLNEAHPSLAKDALNHLKVLRPKDGEEVELFDGRGLTRVYRYDAVTKTLGDPQPLVTHPRPPRDLTLFACVTKGSRWDWTIEKATELGVTRIVPVISDRTIVRVAPDECEAKRERWARVAADAARQSDAVWLPEVTAPVTFAESLPLVQATNCFIGALTNPPPEPMAKAVREKLKREVEGRVEGEERDVKRGYGIYVGPEGDFTPEELSALLAIATPVSFGPTVLRAETAAIFGVSVLAALTDC